MATVNVRLTNNDVKAILSNFFGIREKDVIAERYSFCIEGISAEEVNKKIEEIKKC